jgi:hypothetical protein
MKMLLMKNGADDHTFINLKYLVAMECDKDKVTFHLSNREKPYCFYMQTHAEALEIYNEVIKELNKD